MTAFTPQPMPQPIPPVGYLPPHRAAWLRWWLAMANVTHPQLRADLVAFSEELYAEATTETYHRAFADGGEEARVRAAEPPPPGPLPPIQFESTWNPPPDRSPDRPRHALREGGP